MKKIDKLGSSATDLTQADLIINNAMIITVDDHRRLIPAGYVAVRTGEIMDVGAGEPASAIAGPDTELIDAKGGILVPGFISAHQHVIDVLLRGLSQERNLLDWAMNIYFPGTTAYEPEDIEVAVYLGMDEALRSGITTVVDNWSASLDPIRSMESADAALRAYERIGVRVVFARMFSDAIAPSMQPLLDDLLGRSGSAADLAIEDTDAALSAIETLLNRYHGSADGRIQICPSPATVQFVSIGGLQGARQLAQRFGTILPIHHCETQNEHEMENNRGATCSATEFLGELGLLERRLVAAHCVWLNDQDIQMVASSGTSVVHCPSSNMMLGSGIAPIPALLRSGVTVGLGCDNAMLNNNLSLLGEMRLASFLAKVGTLDASAMTPERALEMATRDSARAIGRGKDLGVIEPGRRADLVLFDTSRAHWCPMHNPAAAVVYQAHPDDVHTVVVDGKVVVRNREPQWLANLPESDLIAQARVRAKAIIERAGLGHLRLRPWLSKVDHKIRSQ